jgi:hypothetical protein
VLLAVTTSADTLGFDAATFVIAAVTAITDPLSNARECARRGQLAQVSVDA